MIVIYNYWRKCLSGGLLDWNKAKRRYLHNNLVTLLCNWLQITIHAWVRYWSVAMSFCRFEHFIISLLYLDTNEMTRGKNELMVFSRRSDGRYGFEKYFKLYCALPMKTDLHFQPTLTQLETSNRLQFNSSLFPHKLFKMFLHWHTFFNMCHTCKTRLNT